jgi:serine/threonine protein kinase
MVQYAPTPWIPGSWEATVGADVRYCPICKQTMEEPVCPKDSVATVPRDLVNREPADDAVGKVFSSRYRVERLLGQGGFGRVYVATQLSMGRTVALKTLHPELVHDENHLQRFYLEARAASHLRTPHVVRIFDFGVDEETLTPFIAMEELEGRTLAEEIARRGFLRPKHAARVIEHVSHALLEAGQAGIVHRDLKPENIFLVATASGDDFAKVMDFGIAKMVGPGHAPDHGVTATGVTIGTPSYMAPEQILGELVDPRCDLYALGCILHESLTGRVPFAAAERLPLLMMHVNDEPPTLPDPLPGGEALPRALAVLHRRLLAKSRNDRPLDARSVVEVLAAVQRGEDVNARVILGTERPLATGNPLAYEDTFPARPAMAPGEEDTTATDVQAAGSDSPSTEGATRALVAPATPATTSDVTVLDRDFAARARAGERQASGTLRNPVRMGAIAAVLVAIIAAGVVLALNGRGKSTLEPGSAVSASDAGSRAAGGGRDAKDGASRTSDPGTLVRGGSDAGKAAMGVSVASPKPPGEAPLSAEPASAGATGHANAEKPGPPGSPPPEADRVKVHVESTPAGAAVYHRGRRICRVTPCQPSLPSSERPLLLTLKKSGYLDKPIKVRTSAGAKKRWTASLIKDRVF